MTANPYESPRLDETKPRAARLVERRRGPLEMAMIGLVAGGFIGATAGAIAAGLLGLSAGLAGLTEKAAIQGNDTFLRPDPTGLLLLGAIAGCLLGGSFGAPLGLLAGLVTGFISARWRRMTIAITALTAALLGIFVGACVGRDFTRSGFAGDELWILVGGVLGGLAGLAGGALLGRGLGILAWGKPGQGSPRQDVDTVSS